MEYKIEKDVPMPLGYGKKYPFTKMAVGDSVFFKDEPRGAKSKPSAAAWQVGKLNGWRFASRTEGTGVRIWRME